MVYNVGVLNWTVQRQTTCQTLTRSSQSCGQEFRMLEGQLNGVQNVVLHTHQTSNVIPCHVRNLTQRSDNSDSY